VKDADTEMSEAPATTEPAVKVRCIFWPLAVQMRQMEG
jgi:hypothetical protein